MEISFEDINKETDPYQLFLDSIKSPDTLRRYRNFLNDFLKLIPSKIYEEVLKKSPQNREPKLLATYFLELAKISPETVSRIIVQYIKNQIELVKTGQMSPNTLPNHVKPIKAFLDSNGVALHWKSFYKLYPRARPAADDRAYTREELQKMLEISTDITDKIIIQMFSAGGFRLESWNYFIWKDVVFFKNQDGSFKGAALLVYRGDPESYWTFLTPECCRSLEIYREMWRSQTGRYPKPDEPLLKSVKYPIVTRLNALGVKKRIEKIVKAIGLRPPLPAGKRRHEVALDHGFRKYFATMMRRAKVNFLDKEDMMGHKVGLEQHYERYQEDDFERFPEYQKAISFLTISDSERQKYELELKDKKINEIEGTIRDENKKLSEDLEILKLKVERMAASSEKNNQ